MLGFGADLEYATAEVATGGGGEGEIEWERVLRETIVMYAMTPWGWPFKLAEESVLFSVLEYTHASQKVTYLRLPSPFA